MAGIKSCQASGLPPAWPVLFLVVRLFIKLLHALIEKRGQSPIGRVTVPYPPASVTVKVSSASALLTLTLTCCPGTVRSIK
jgi:hypothetical protein